MKTNRAIVIVLLSGFFLLNSCIAILDDTITGNGNVTTEIRTIDDFEGINSSAGLDVYVTFGEFSNEIEVVADENLHEVITTDVKNNILKIGVEEGIRRAKSKEIYVKAGSLRYVGASSASNFEGKGVLEADDLEVDVSSAADLVVEIDCDEVKVDVSSSGTARLMGNARKMKANVSSAGDLVAYDLKTKICDIECSSAGDASIHVTEELKANASSAGNISYRGNPKRTSVESSSAGDIDKR